MFVKLPPKDLNHDPYPSTPHKHLYLWLWCVKRGKEGVDFNYFN